ncbi:hypothetical protein FRC02_002825 [Tulasnella sp. 418]|nr:hypothetical protein FRC02_002825 [Tulasnella sp. 418]
MSGRSWGVSIALGFVSLPLGFLIRCIPNGPVEKLFIKLRIMHDPNVLPVLSPERQQWNEAIDTVRDNLQTFANIRGGRVRASSFVKKSRSQRLQEAGIQLPQLLTMVPTLVMSSIGAGWQPQPGSMADPAGSDPSKSSAALFAGQIQIHPDTPKDDPVYAKYGHSQQSPV